ncbi:MAG: flagellar protein FliT [bacterium]
MNNNTCKAPAPAPWSNLVTISEQMLDAARKQDWDTLTGLDKKRMNAIEGLRGDADGTPTDLLEKQAKRLMSMDREIRDSVQAAKSATADALKKSRSNRAAVNKYLEGEL